MKIVLEIIAQESKLMEISNVKKLVVRKKGPRFPSFTQASHNI